MPILITVQRLFLVALTILAVVALYDLPRDPAFVLGKVAVGILFILLPLLFLVAGFVKKRLGYFSGALSWILFPPLLALAVGFLTSSIPLLQKIAELIVWMLVPVALAVYWIRSERIKDYYGQKSPRASD